MVLNLILSRYVVLVEVVSVSTIIRVDLKYLTLVVADLVSKELFHFKELFPGFPLRTSPFLDGFHERSQGVLTDPGLR